MFISNAFAAAPAQDPTGGMMQFIPLIVIFVLFYFMLIRPQMKRAKEQKNMLEALQKGDEIITTGGQLGKVVKVNENYISVEIAENVVVNVQKAAITTLLPKGTIKNI
ncbi:MAG: preprotein translocase subunit YajC [Pseudomonadota bacterium]|nr:preprotein translocase subunit YajC [Gammaproteobacteria bacterium]MBU1732673.1 preprotein translocase subunit YajC [Gammaproteobacteria bacterium]MBU1891498.1 preprotein translocase subunit YajC [Gammaproteobacteria bacterium]